MDGLRHISEQILTGSDIVNSLEDLASLRLEIFREYPYLYSGQRQDELNYLGSYAAAPDACVILAHDGQICAGAVTGMPLIHEDAHMLEAFNGSSLSPGEIYYVGELLFRPGYRNSGLGRQLLARLEEQIRAIGRYSSLTCATVERPVGHPLCPPDYIPITRFLDRTGFIRLPGVSTNFAWLEVDGIMREHSMQFWIKDLD